MLFSQMLHLLQIACNFSFPIQVDTRRCRYLPV